MNERQVKVLMGVEHPGRGNVSDAFTRILQSAQSEHRSSVSWDTNGIAVNSFGPQWFAYQNGLLGDSNLECIMRRNAVTYSDRNSTALYTERANQRRFTEALERFL